MHSMPLATTGVLCPSGESSRMLHKLSCNPTAPYEVLPCLDHHWALFVYMVGRRLGDVGMSGSVYLQGLAAHLGKHQVSGGARLHGLAARLGKHMVFGCVCPQMSRICPMSEMAPVSEIARKP